MEDYSMVKLVVTKTIIVVIKSDYFWIQRILPPSYLNNYIQRWIRSPWWWVYNQPSLAQSVVTSRFDLIDSQTCFTRIYRVNSTKDLSRRSLIQRILSIRCVQIFSYYFDWMVKIKNRTSKHDKTISCPAAQAFIIHL